MDHRGTQRVSEKLSIQVNELIFDFCMEIVKGVHENTFLQLHLSENL